MPVEDKSCPSALAQSNATTVVKTGFPYDVISKVGVWNFTDLKMYFCVLYRYQRASAVV